MLLGRVLKKDYNILSSQFNKEVDESLIRFYVGHFASFLETSGTCLSLNHHVTALKFSTCSLLGIPHQCCSLDDKTFRYLGSPDHLSKDDIEEEHAFELSLLEEFMEEFEE